MTISTKLMLEIRAEYKRALEMMDAGIKTEQQAKSLLQLLKSFNFEHRPVAQARGTEDSPGFHIKVEPSAGSRRRWDEDDPDITQQIVEPDPKSRHPAK